MKKLLTRIFSVALAAMVAVGSPAVAQQKAQKLGAGSSARSEVTMAVKDIPAQAKDARSNQLPQAKSFANHQSGLQKAKTGVARTPGKVRFNDATNMPILYGNVIYSDAWDDNSLAGVYQVPTNSSMDFNEIAIIGANAGSYGGVCYEGTYYTTNLATFWGMILGLTITGVDIETGEVVYTLDPGTSDFSCIPVGQCVDPVTGSIYGIFWNSEGNSKEFGTITYTPGGFTRTTVSTIAGNWNSLTVDASGQFYGISYESDADGNVLSSKLCKIDRTTGAVTEIGSTGYAPQYITDSCIDKASGRMFWTVCDASETGILTEVDLTTGAASLIYQFPNGEEVVGMFVPEALAEDDAPGALESFTVSFPDGNLAGSATIQTPTGTYAGGAGTGSLTINVEVEGEIVGTATAGYNSEVVVPISVTEAGSYSFVAYAQNAVGKGPKSRVNGIWVGSDTPEAPVVTLVYENGNMELSWTAVTGSINGGYINPDAVTYDVYDQDNNLKAEGLTVTTWSEPKAIPSVATSYFYKVKAIFDGNESEFGVSNKVQLGEIGVPYDSDFAENPTLEGWTVIDGNNDGKIWKVVNGEARMDYNSSLEMDDWLISPGITLEAGKAYDIEFRVKNNSTAYKEKIEVLYGMQPTVAGMTTTLLPPTEVTGSDANAMVKAYTIIPEVTGKYYVGFHGMSDADQFYLYVSYLTIVKGVESTAPNMPTNFTATPDENGEVSATITMNAPAVSVNGAALSSLDKVELYRNEELIKTWSNPTPGEPLSYVDTPAQGGNTTYKAMGYNASGFGLPAEASCFIGFDIPNTPATVNIARTANVGEVNLTWDAVTTDQSGNPLPAWAITYNVYNGGDLIASDLTTTSYSFQAVEAGEQDFVQCLVVAATSVGEGTGRYSDMIPVGTPYPGLHESGLLDTIWGLNSSGGAEWALYTDEQFSDMTSQDNDNAFFGAKGSQVGHYGDLFSGLISLENIDNPGVSFYTLNIRNDAGDADTNELAVFVRTLENDEWTPLYAKSVDDICGGVPGEWAKAIVGLADYAGQTIQVQFRATTNFYIYTFLDNITVGTMVGNDLLAKAITAPATVARGADYTVDVTVINEGVQSASGWSVDLYANGDKVATKPGSELNSGANEVVSFDQTMGAVQTDAVTYYAVVVYDGDENLDNNETEDVTVAPKASTLPGVDDLSAECVANGVKLAWSEPQTGAPQRSAGEPITEDFEDADAFSAEYGDWTFVDLDQSAVGGFQGTAIPGITPGTTTGSFWIWDQSQLGNQTFEAHSGTKYLFALFRYDDGTTDDWAISPMLSGGEQEISFWAKSYSTSYPEKIAVYYTTTDSTNPDDFEMVAGSQVNSVPGTWTLYTVTVPMGSQRFAIRSFATGSFMLMVDDVTYIPGTGAPAELLGYEVYRNGEKISGESFVEDTEFVDTNVTEGTTYDYVVVAVYNFGVGNPSNIATITYVTSGLDKLNAGISISSRRGEIVINNAADTEIMVTTVDGKVVFRGMGEPSMVIPVSEGIYIVKADKKVSKLIVK